MNTQKSLLWLTCRGLEFFGNTILISDEKGSLSVQLLLWPQLPFNAKYFTNVSVETLFETVLPLKSFVRYSA